MSSGIYYVYNRVNNHFYIGSSNNLEKRWIKEHRSLLRNNKHCNPHLQAAWNKYGESAFEFRHLLYCKIEDLKKWEQPLLDKFVGTKECYNISKDATAPMRGRKFSEESKQKLKRLGPRHHFFDKKFSSEHRQKLSEGHLGQIAWNKGKQLSAEHKLALSKAKLGKKYPNSSIKRRGCLNPRAKFSVDELKVIKEALTKGEKCSTLAKRYNVSHSIISHIKHNRTYRD